MEKAVGLINAFQDFPIANLVVNDNFTKSLESMTGRKFPMSVTRVESRSNVLWDRVATLDNRISRFVPTRARVAFAIVTKALKCILDQLGLENGRQRVDVKFFLGQVAVDARAFRSFDGKRVLVTLGVKASVKLNAEFVGQSGNQATVQFVALKGKDPNALSVAEKFFTQVGKATFLLESVPNSSLLLLVSVTIRGKVKLFVNSLFPGTNFVGAGKSGMNLLGSVGCFGSFTSSRGFLGYRGGQGRDWINFAG